MGVAGDSESPSKIYGDEMPVRRKGRECLPLAAPAKSGGGGFSVFLIIAIVTALVAFNRARMADRPRPLPPSPRMVQPRLPSNALPWSSDVLRPIEPDRSRERPAGWSWEYPPKERASSVRARGTVQTGREPSVRIEAPGSPTQMSEAVDRIIRNANEQLRRMEADRGAIHKSWPRVSGPQRVDDEP